MERAVHYTRYFQTHAGTDQLRMPKLRSVPFETAIIERYRRRESSVEEALVEMYLAGVSFRRVEDITDEKAIIERYRRRESSVEEARVEMNLAGGSFRRAADSTEERGCMQWYRRPKSSVAE